MPYAETNVQKWSTAGKRKPFKQVACRFPRFVGSYVLAIHKDCSRVRDVRDGAFIWWRAVIADSRCGGLSLALELLVCLATFPGAFKDLLAVLVEFKLGNHHLTGMNTDGNTLTVCTVTGNTLYM